MTDHTFLDKQFALYDEQAQSLESWQVDHKAAMLCREVEDTIGLGLTILAGIRRHNKEWTREVERTPATFLWEDAEFFAGRYRWWHEKTAILLRVIEFCESDCGFVVDGASDLRQEHNEVSLMSLDTERVRESILSLEEGRGIPPKQAMNELRNRLRQAGP